MKEEVPITEVVARCEGSIILFDGVKGGQRCFIHLGKLARNY